MTTRIMVVDDELAIGTLLLYQLQNLGYEAVYVQDGMQALQRVLLEQPDLILLDVMMPQLNGWEVCREIRSCSNVPIIMVTGKDANDDVVAGLSAGADDYVTKPFVMSQLQARVEAVLRRSQAGNGYASITPPKNQEHLPAFSQANAEPVRPVYVSEQPHVMPSVVSQQQVALATPAGSLNVTPMPVVAGMASSSASALALGQEPESDKRGITQHLGLRLRQARQERSISLYQAERLCQSRWDILQALEQENWNYAPRQQMHTALVAYASLLKVDLQPYNKRRKSPPTLLDQNTILMLVLAIVVVVAIILFVL